MKPSIVAVSVLALASMVTASPIDCTSGDITTNHALQCQQIPTEVQKEAESVMVHDTTTLTGDNRRLATVVYPNQWNTHTHTVIYVVLGSVAGVIFIVVVSLRLFLDCSMLSLFCVGGIDWKRLCGKRSKKPSDGFPQLELGSLGTQEQSVSHGVEVAQSGGHPFMNKNTLDSHCQDDGETLRSSTRPATSSD